MEWMRIIGDAVQYIEAHITEELTTDGIANAVCVSPFYFQRGFAMLLPISQQILPADIEDFRATP